MSSANLPPQGWYPDPYDPTVERWWSGSAWTGHTKARAQSVHAAPMQAPAFGSPPSVDPRHGPTVQSLGFRVAPQRNVPAVVSLTLSGVALFLAVIGVGLWGLLLALIAVGFAIAALVRASSTPLPRSSAVWSILSAVILIPITFVAGVYALGSARMPTADVQPPVVLPSGPAVANEPSEAAPDPVSAEAAPSGPEMGQVVVNDDGVGFTVAAIECGLASTGDSFLDASARGQFCKVAFVVDNGSDGPISLSAGDIGGRIGNSEYASDQARFGDDYYFAELNPGLSLDGVVYIDIPVGAALDFIHYDDPWDATEAIVVRVG